jgi:hypothetical protein
MHGNPSLAGLTGLSNVTFIDGNITIAGNPALTSLLGLDQILPDSINDLKIIANSSLSVCAIQSICDYLTNPNGTIEIHDNAIGCNNTEEIKQACDSLPVPEISRPCRFMVYPNPFSEATMISFELDTPAAIEVIIYDELGKVVSLFPRKEYHPGAHSVTWLAEDLPAGVFFLRLQAGTRMETKKIVKL